MSGKIYETTQFEDAGVTLANRVEGNGGSNITQASISSIAYDVTQHDSRQDALDAANGSSVVDGGALTVASVVFDTLQTAAPWDSSIEATGYNFRYDSPASDRPTGGKWHRYEIKFTPASGAAFFVVWVVHTLPIQGS